MKKMGVNELREAFLSFFESKNHMRLNSFSLVPKNDKSLLLINSGMAPLKPYFKGIETPPSRRVTTCQKCIRTGDIDNVGITDRHGTFFEMLGNFSFGDYFKEEAIKWSWEFLTQVLEIPEEKLYVTVYEEDDETLKIWNEKMGLPLNKIFKMGKEDNYWEHGTGPCGPCSEIYYDRGEKYGCGKESCTVGCDCDRYIEIWNNVFSQFDAKEDGTYAELKQKNIDTGMGLERLATVMQDTTSIFDVDTVKAIREKVCEIANVEYGKDKKTDISIRVITDHIRSATFMTSDGIMFSNEGRGYVLRRLLRRAKRHGMLLGIEGMFLNKLVNVVIESGKNAYKELEDKKDFIFKSIEAEEEKFDSTLKTGMILLEEYVENAKKKGIHTLSGKDAFKLYDTYGFPIELTCEILKDKSMDINKEEFDEEMKKQKERARNSRSVSNYMGRNLSVYDEIDDNIVTEFVGYNELESNSKVLTLIVNNKLVTKAVKGDEVSLVLNTTPFYARSGGQQGDKGIIESDAVKLIVEDTIKVKGNKIVHICSVESGELNINDNVVARVDQNIRRMASQNHTATHLLQKALRTVLGSHVEQSGSDVSSDRLRFDFTHFEAINSKTLSEIEKVVNASIMAGLDVVTKEMPIDEARNMGAMALFGEKYGNFVRVVNASNYSIELCGGTHVKNTSEIGIFKIVSESSVASGIRRIEAITGVTAMNYYDNVEKALSSICTTMRCNKDEVVEKVENLLVSVKEKDQELLKIKSGKLQEGIDEMISSKQIINGMNVIAKTFKDSEMKELIELADKVKDRLKSCIVLFATENGTTANILVTVTDDLVSTGIKAGELVKEMAVEIGGKGGGRPNMAQAGGKNFTNIQKSIDKGINLLFNK